MDSGKKRAVKVWHRKAGKEKVDWNFEIKKSQERVGNYWYVFPKLTQARKVIWDGIDQAGFRFLDHAPKEILDGEPNSTSMLVRFKNRSTIQLIGGDTFDKTSVGGNPVGVVFSEYSLTDPYLWSYVRPILAVNGGWAAFNFTPRGENHAHDLLKLAQGDPDNWFSEVLTVDDTQAIPRGVLEQERREIIKLNGDDSLFQQEYYCSFTVPIAGSYYATHIARAYEDSRVGNVQWDQRFLVDTWWDLGRGDHMAVWFSQSVGNSVRLIDYMSGSGAGIIDYITEIRRKPYQYNRHTAPHDIRATEIFSGKTRYDAAAELEFDFEICPKIAIDDGIDAVRSLFPRMWFDAEKCKDGINALKNYTKQYDESRKVYLNVPFHNWASHGADAMRTLAVGLDAYDLGIPVKRDSYEDDDRRSQHLNPMTV
jgi:hypothetical protein